MRYGLAVLACAVAAFLQIHLLDMASPALKDNMGTWIDVAWRHIDNPAMLFWTGYHTRMLGVGLIVLMGGDLRAYMEVTWFALVLAGLLSLKLGGGGGFGILHACFALFASPWFSPWDMFEPAIFIAFVLLVVEQMSWYWFVALFSLAIFNLQSAMFITIWMVLSGRMLWAGIGCIVLGCAVMWYFQHSGQPRLGLNVFQCLDGHSRGYTSDYAQARIAENFNKLFVLNDRAVLGVIAVIALACLRVPWQLGVTYAALLLATLVLGIVDEMRVYLPFIPLLIVAAI